MPQQDFAPFAGSADANVVSQSDFLASNWLPVGFSQGTAFADQLNKVWRQSSIITAAIAQAISDVLDVDVIDDGTIQTIEQNFLALFHTQSRFFAQDTGNVNNLVINLPQYTGLLSGLSGTPIIVKIANSNTGTATLNVNALGAIRIINPDGSILSNNQLIANSLAIILFDGISYELMSTVTGPLNLKANTWTQSQIFATSAAFQSSITVATSATANSLVATAGVSAGTGYLTTGVDAGGLNLRAIAGNFGAGFRNDGVGGYLLQTASGNQFGQYTTLRPFYWIFTTGAVRIDDTGAGVNFGGNIVVQGGIAASGNITTLASVSSTTGMTSNGFDSGGFNFRAIDAGYGIGFRNDGQFGYLLQTANGNSTGVPNSFRPFLWSLTTGAVNIDLTGAGTTLGGNVGIAGGVTILNGAAITGVVTASSDITSGGKVRSAVGALNKGDINQCPIISDWTTTFSAINFGWERQPSGLIHQWVSASVPAGGGLVSTLINLPVAFPNNNLGAIVSFLGNSPPQANNPGSICVEPFSTSQVQVTTAYQVAATMGVVILAIGS